MKKVIIFMFVVVGLCFAQENTAPSGGTSAVRKADTAKTADKMSEKEKKKYAELPAGYRGISVGMGFEEVKKALTEDPVFGYRGERDISLLPTPNRTLIETAGSMNIKRSWFQFYEDKLYIIIIQMDTDKIDYYSVYSALTEKYGEPALIDPKRAVWKNESVSLTLERPLAVKYIDLAVFNGLLEKSGTEKVASDIMREEFIHDF